MALDTGNTMKVALDTNCFIDGENSAAIAYTAMQDIYEARMAGRLELVVSQHTLAELKVRGDSAYLRAMELPVLPCYPIGTWDDLVGTWGGLAGTWDGIGQNQAIQEELKALAKSGNDIRDRGAYVDALHASAEFFVTSDGQLANASPAKRIRDRFGLRVVTPRELVAELAGPSV